VAPLSGTTLLVLVTLVLATGQRDSLPVRQSLGETRWAEPATLRQSPKAESRPTSPTKPSSVKFAGLGGFDTRRVFAMLPLPGADSPIGEASTASQCRVREALLNLPPPQC